MIRAIMARLIPLILHTIVLLVILFAINYFTCFGYYLPHRQIVIYTWETNDIIATEHPFYIAITPDIKTIYGDSEMDNTTLKGYFWYSEKQKKAIKDLLGHTNLCKLESGQIVEYTEMTEDKTNTSLWDDKIFLGYGEWYKSN